MANVKALMADAAKRFGKNGLFLLGDGEEMLLIERQSTGILTLDAMLGGGIPLGKIIQNISHLVNPAALLASRLKPVCLAESAPEA